MKRSLWMLVAVIGLASAAHAGSQNDAGCGLGAQLFKDNRPVDQILGATTNGTSGNQTFAITTGTLGCSSGGLIKSSREREVFTASNLRVLEQELAAGKGEYTASLAALSGCPAAPFQAFAKSHYDALFPSDKTTSSELLIHLDQAIGSNSAMAKACAL
ncbi:MAG: DUF3015 family protein [Elusimicrobia bacterium]|nr:DUF3015 family protein [Elusimicrobiota bacterium]